MIMTVTSRTLATFALFGALALAGQAFAHAHLASVAPADKATIASAPKSIDLSFTEGLEPKFSGVDITGPQQQKIKTGEAVVSKDGKGLSVPLSEPLAPGAYSVEWHVLSVDGHKSNGTTSFTVKP
ncbi:copper homeostasis periplasmic binding protein CopC [Agrobacterium vitis]|uniref:copper homeostasis periplasmic binding protein CopC n=1 Tax=Allorhizobium ampelinum TaxID=3025782 RepID=UPI001F44AC9F|nr:copper homeostasis periplasmic binding protein CopC [Allorhizobium ampelinum]MCF1473953.1 copper homeostasis periplasmic binding protein CopC [Allorhizobium ampelinum]